MQNEIYELTQREIDLACGADGEPGPENGDTYPQIDNIPPG